MRERFTDNNSFKVINRTGDGIDSTSVDNHPLLDLFEEVFEEISLLDNETPELLQEAK